MLSLTLSPCHNKESTLCTPYTEQQHILTIAYTQYSINPNLTVTSSRPVSYLSSRHGPCSTLLFPLQWLWVHQYIEFCLLTHLPSHLWPPDQTAPLSPPNALARCPIRPPSECPNWVNHGHWSSNNHHLQVYIHMHSIVTFQFAKSSTPCLHNHCVQVQNHTQLIMVSKLALSGPPRYHDESIQVILQTRSIMGSKYISEFTGYQPPSASLSSLNVGLHPCSCRNALYHYLKVHL